MKKIILLSVLLLFIYANNCSAFEKINLNDSLKINQTEKVQQTTDNKTSVNNSNDKLVITESLTSNNYREVDKNISSYMTNIQKIIKSNWNPPKDTNNKQVIVIFRMMKNGTITATNIYKSSGNNENDKSAIEAVEKSSPLPPMPKEWKRNYADIKFTFDYNVFYGYKTNIQKDINDLFIPYIQDLKMKIHSNWNPPQVDESKSVKILFTIMKDGTVKDIKVIKSSGDIVADNKAIEAVKNSSPFQSLPEKYDKDSVDILFDFEHDAFSATKNDSKISKAIAITDETLGFNFPEYNKDMQTRIYRNFYVPEKFSAKNKKLNSIIEFKVLRDGTIQKINVKASSGNQEFDNYCIDAINKSSPLPPLPEEYERNYVFIQYNFKFMIKYDTLR